MSFEWMLAAVLAVWRITHLLAFEDGPFDAMLRLRLALGQGRLGQLMDCFYCLSLFVALPVLALLHALQPLPSVWAVLLVWPALSGGAVLLQRVTDRDAQMDGAHKGN